MAQKASNNIFDVLSDNEYDEDAPKQSQGAKDRKDKKNKPKQTEQRKVEEKQTRTQNTQSTAFDEKEHRGPHKKNQRPQKGVSEEPHPLDRHSGTGISGVNKRKFRKDGGGPGNAGTIKDQLVGRDADKEEEVNDKNEKQVEETKVTTLNEYLEQKGYNLNSEVKEEKKPKKQIAQQDLEKEKLTLVKTKEEIRQQEEDDRQEHKVKAHETYHASINTQHAELLNFTSGYSQKEGPKRPKRNYNREKKETNEGEKEPAQKKEQEGTSNTAQTAEQKPAEEKPQTTQKKETTQDNNEKKPRYEKKREGGGGREGYQNRGGKDQRGGNKKFGGGAKRQQGQDRAPKIDVDDESNFPKLG